MTDSSANNKRIAKNTLFLYFRLFIVMLVSLYTSRLLLKILGINDYGIQNVVGGFVSLFSLISGTTHVTISRFLTYEIGTGNEQRLRNVFSTSVNIQALFCFIIIILAETLGLWFINYQVIIPEERVYAANWIYQISIISFCVGLLCTPYNAVIIAHEKMSSFALFSIIETVLKLLVVLILPLINIDHLVTYSLLLMLVQLFMRLIYGLYCVRRFPESKYSFLFDRKLICEMGGYAGWNYLGTVAFLLRTQGLNILMNLFFGVAINAARGIVAQVENAVLQFVSNFTTALNPQITKSYARNDLTYLNMLVCQGAKFTFYLLLLMVIPLMFETPIILRIWLGEYPERSVLFMRLTLCVVLIDKLCDTITMALLASGDIKKLQIMAGASVIPVIPIAYILYSYGAPDYVGYALCMMVLVAKFLLELYLAKVQVGIPITYYLREVLLRILFVLLLSLVVPSYIYLNYEESYVRMISLFIFSTIFTSLAIYYTGINSGERFLIRLKCTELAKRIYN
jgi:O-antigen/teichoic acid export membrane protein